MSNKYFSIIVQGRDSSEAEEGNLNKTTGLPDGPTTKIKLTVGAVSIPNFSRVWAKKALVGKDQKYQGELQFLPWGHKEGEQVNIRYLPGANSLDRNYQNTVLKMELSEEEKNENSYIDLELGINDFNTEIANPLFILMLKHHTYNEDNASRQPGTKSNVYKEYSAATINKHKVEKAKAAQRAQNIVLEAEGDTERLDVLAALFDLDPKQQSEVIFNDMFEMFEDSPQKINETLDFHRAKFKHQLQSLTESKTIELTAEGDLVDMSDGDRKVIATEVETKNTVVYLTENIAEPSIYKIYKALQEITENQLAALQ